MAVSSRDDLRTVRKAAYVSAAIDAAVRLLCATTPDDRAGHLEAGLQRVDEERARYVAAIGAGGQLPGHMEALQQRDASRPYRLSCWRSALSGPPAYARRPLCGLT